MEVVYAPDYSYIQKCDEGLKFTIFLGGSIEMGAAEEWQELLISFLRRQSYADQIVLFNPRRKDWDSSWPNTKEFAPFKEQVEWELDHQTSSNLNVYWFAANTLSPITLLELGLFEPTGPIVGIDPAYLRKGNLEIVADRYDICTRLSWEEFIAEIDLVIREQLEWKL